MQTYRVPGVYFEWLDPARAIQAARTDIAALVGISARGPLHTPTKVESWTQFASKFGTHIPNAYLAYAAEGFFTNGGKTCWIVRVADPNTASAATGDVTAAGDSSGTAMTLTAASSGVWARGLRISVMRNAGDRFTFSLRLPDGSQEVWRGMSMAAPYVDLLDATGAACLRLAAADPQLWPRQLAVRIALDGPASFSLSLRVDGLETAFWQNLVMDAASPENAPAVINRGTALQARALTQTVGRIPDPSASNLRGGSVSLEGDARFVGALLNDPDAGSNLVAVSRIANPAFFPENLPDDAVLPGMNGGSDGLGSGLSLNHFTGDTAPANRRWGLATLETVDEVRIVAMPDAIPSPPVTVAPPPFKRDCTIVAVQPALPSPPPPDFPTGFGLSGISVLQQAMVRHCELLKSRTCVLDAPSATMTPAEIEDWRLQFDSSYAALYFPWVQATDPLELTGLLRAVPPSGHVSGIYARCDLTIGVQKPPANELVEGAKDLTYAVDDSDHGDLNDVGIDAIRALSGRGIRVAGARTLSSDSLLLYINVRRLLIMIEQSFLSYAQWTVFEPNNPDLWREITRAGRAFLDGLWKQGFLDGASANEAYSVVCDATTNPPGQTDAGMVVCEIGVLPPWPAEFVIVRIGVTVDKTEILETTGVSHG